MGWTQHNLLKRSVCLWAKYLNSCHRLKLKRCFHVDNNPRLSQVELTSKTYPGVKRGQFATLNDSDIEAFKKIVDGRVITEESELSGYNVDWLKTVRGESKICVRPKTTEEMSAVVKHCHDRGLAINPQGGNTGLVGGSVPVFDEVVVSTALMNQIISVDKISGVLICQAGCVLEALDNHISDFGLTMPLDLGAKGSCHIGGNLATNAGGIRLLRYGSLHASTLGIEAVMPNGEILDCLSSLRKDNTGYDLKHLMIGSEGTLGIITKAAILCPQKPKIVNLAFLGCKDFATVLSILQECKKDLAEILSAYEFLDRDCMTVQEENLGLSNPISSSAFYIVIETSGSNKEHDEDKLNNLLAKLIESGKADDGTLATDHSKIEAIWGVRERMAEGLLHDGYCYKYDVSLPHEHFYEVVEVMRERLKGKAKRVTGYGHVGDGNLHFNVTSPAYDKELLNLIEPFFYDWVSERKGSVSAEHGLGFKKRQYIYHSKSQSAVTLMQTMKKLVDPKGIMNPYKFLPD